MFGVEEAEKQVRAALDSYPDDPSGLSDVAVEAGFAELHRLSEAVEARRLQWLADLERRATYRRDGYLSIAAWLADRFRVAAGTAKQQAKVATALQEMPEVREALASGELSTGAARVLVSAREAHPEVFALQERALVEEARTRPVDELRRVVEDWSSSADQEDALQQAEHLRERRHMHICPTPSGMVRVSGELDRESGEAVLTAVQAIVDADLRAAGGHDLRTPEQRRADAVGELGRRYLDSRERPVVAGERPHVTVTVDVSTLKEGIGKSELDHTGPVHPEAARRLACDASVMRVVMAGPSEPLDVGRRTPVISPALRRAVVVRDAGCRFPRCDRPHAWCDAHHVVHWADGGETALRNLVLLCRPHHRLLHEGGFHLEMVEDKPVFRRPDGSVLEDRAPP
jgi:hypothetical protein